ncbi:MAG: TetR/AcrR family transcriptional regulator [Chitinophagaceae bacterium]|nr:TetR/AcrR family transcriptional regulator [Chitinophagaceae bacterium]
MTIASRKQKEKEDKRTLILDAARKVFLEKGYAQASIRNIAEEIEHSPGTIYLYFKDKDEIFHALHEEGFGRMLEKMEPLRFVSDPFERLKALGRVYLDFAKNNKDFYDLMFVIQSPLKHETEDEKWEMGTRTLGTLKDIVRQCQEAGRFQGKDIDYLSFVIWAGVHGMATLYCHDRCLAFDDLKGEDLLNIGHKYFVEMLEKY